MQNSIYKGKGYLGDWDTTRAHIIGCYHALMLRTSIPKPILKQNRQRHAMNEYPPQHLYAYTCLEFYEFFPKEDRLYIRVPQGLFSYRVADKSLLTPESISKWFNEFIMQVIMCDIPEEILGLIQFEQRLAMNNDTDTEESFELEGLKNDSTEESEDAPPKKAPPKRSKHDSDESESEKASKKPPAKKTGKKNKF